METRLPLYPTLLVTGNVCVPIVDIVAMVVEADEKEGTQLRTITTRQSYSQGMSNDDEAAGELAARFDEVAAACQHAALAFNKTCYINVNFPFSVHSSGTKFVVSGEKCYSWNCKTAAEAQAAVADFHRRYMEQFFPAPKPSSIPF